MLSLLGAMTTLCSMSAHAVMPDNIQAALSRAALSPTDISIIVTPVGDKTASRLPPIITVVDSPKNSPADIVSVPTVNTAPTTEVSNATQNNNTPTKLPKAIVINKQEIVQQERKLHRYTDDAYTYQSIENPPSVLATSDIMTNRSSVSSSVKTLANDTVPKTLPDPNISLNPLINHQPDIARTPASTMKLIPSFIALDTLGADFVWQTRVYHSGLIIGNRLYGDLIIQGSGDPKMTHERLQQLLYRVKQSGIQHINGNIVVDSSIFSHVSKNPAAFDNAPLRPYNASPDGFLVNFSTMGIHSYPLDNEQAQLTYTPQLANYQLPSVVNTRTATCSQASYSLAPQWQYDKLTFNAAMPASCAEHIFYVAYPDAKDFATRVIAAQWQTLGNTLSGKVIAQEKPYRRAIYHHGQAQADTSPQMVIYAHAKQGLTAIAVSPLPIVSYPSLTLTEQIYDINHFSNNVMTEQVALSIGAYQKAVATKAKNLSRNTTSKASSLYQFGTSKPTDYSQALSSLNDWWQTHLTTPPPIMTNGSGLCRECTVTAANLSELLTYAYHHPSFGAYVNSLGIAGVSGTIVAHSERLPQSAAIGRAWIKTGTLDNVTSMAGYVKGQSGQDYTVVGIINTEQSLNAYTARPVLDALLDWTAQH